MQMPVVMADSGLTEDFGHGSTVVKAMLEPLRGLNSTGACATTTDPTGLADFNSVMWLIRSLAWRSMAKHDAPWCLQHRAASWNRAPC